MLDADPTFLELLDPPATLPLVVAALGWNAHLYHSHLDVHPPSRFLLPRLPHVRELAERHQLARLEPGLLPQLAQRRDVERLAALDRARDGVPVAAALG